MINLRSRQKIIIQTLKTAKGRSCGRDSWSYSLSNHKFGEAHNASTAHYPYWRGSLVSTGELGLPVESVRQRMRWSRWRVNQWCSSVSFCPPLGGGWMDWYDLSQFVFCSLESSWILLAVFSFSSRISLNFFMFSKNSGLRFKVMNSFAFLLSPLLLEVYTVMVSVRISLNDAYWFLHKLDLTTRCAARAWTQAGQGPLTWLGFQQQLR